MQVQRRQNTISRVCHVSGRGYWSGVPVTVTFRPAHENSGVVFQRSDLPRQPIIPVSASARMETALRTRLGVDDACVDMVEHILSALYALQIDNCIVECTAREMPGLDGSSMAYAVALEQAGVCRQQAPARTLVIDAPHRIGDDRQWIMVSPTNQVGFTCEYRLDYLAATNIPSGTFTTTVTPDLYMDEIAPARTFVTKSEADQLQAKGLAGHVTHRDLLVFDEDGPIDNVLRFDNECARHKLLDLIGDLALCGVPISGKVTAYRSGHILNGRMAAWLEEQAQIIFDSTRLRMNAA
jgi:UDP-3-O-[3-hydroxymyristoyl] N-acetylglucosamine deacetylase